ASGTRRCRRASRSWWPVLGTTPRLRLRSNDPGDRRHRLEDPRAPRPESATRRFSVPRALLLAQASCFDYDSRVRARSSAYDRTPVHRGILVTAVAHGRRHRADVKIAWLAAARDGCHVPCAAKSSPLSTGQSNIARRTRRWCAVSGLTRTAAATPAVWHA